LELSANFILNTITKIWQVLKEAHHKTLAAVSPVLINKAKVQFYVSKFNSLIFLKYLIASGFANDAKFLIS
jgi:hypothetical protein